MEVFSLTAVWLTLILLLMAGPLMSGALRPDLAALILALGLSFSGLLSPQEAFSGFSRSAVIALIALFILTAGLNRTGVSRALGERLSRWAGDSPGRLVAGMTLLSASLSLAMNSVTAAAVVMPMAVQAARRIGLAPSRILIPIAYGALLGGMPTLFTTANLLLSGLMRDHYGRSLTMLDFIRAGLLPAALGLLWVIGVTWRTLPERSPAGQLMRLHRLNRELAELYGLQDGLVELLVEPDSPLCGLSLVESQLASRHSVTVIGIRRKGLRLVVVRGGAAVSAEQQELDLPKMIEGGPGPNPVGQHGGGRAVGAQAGPQDEGRRPGWNLLRPFVDPMAAVEPQEEPGGHRHRRDQGDQHARVSPAHLSLPRMRGTASGARGSSSEGPGPSNYSPSRSRK